MSSNILEQRRACFIAWNATLARARMFPPHPLHERDEPATLQEEEPGKPTAQAVFDLHVELAAWEQASDDDFEKFEQSLE